MSASAAQFEPRLRSCPGRHSSPASARCLGHANIARKVFRGFPVSAVLDKEIEHVTVLVHRAPLRRTLTARTELQATGTHRFVRNVQVVLGQQVFDISDTPAESIKSPGNGG